jgi:hypothetical protein
MYLVGVSFHCVLKQPQSDQAVGGIVSLLKKQFGNVDLEIIEETNRGKNVPLLVVLYNLSRLTDDAKGALRDIEGWKILSYSCSRSAC